MGIEGGYCEKGSSAVGSLWGLCGAVAGELCFGAFPQGSCGRFDGFICAGLGRGLYSSALPVQEQKINIQKEGI
jgi:hypothetical protein